MGNSDSGDTALDEEKAAQVFSYDVKNFNSKFKNGENWHVMIVGHLYCDHVITRTLSDALPNPKKIDLGRSTFSSKVDLASALGLLDAAQEGFLRRINRLRNKIAHDLLFNISDLDITELYNLTHRTTKELIDEEEIRTNYSRLSNILRVSVILLDLNRQRWAVYRVQQREFQKDLMEAIRNAREVLDSLDGPSTAVELR